VQQRGARSIVVGGASIGAMASLFALEHDQRDVNGFIWIAGLTDASGYTFTRASVRKLGLPTLIISARSDPYLAEDSARHLSRWMGLPNRLLLLPSDLHGTDMLSADAPTKLRGRLVSAIGAFVEDVT
jgi:predicted alpha/beta hydrolase family esterase